MAAEREAQNAAEEQKHIDLNGNEFKLPDFTMKQIHDAIPAHCFKPSTLRSMAYVVRDYFYWSALMYISLTYIPLLQSPILRFAAWTLYTVVAGFVFTGIWILAHECGHGAFSKSKTLNYTMGLLMHSFLLVPFHSWRLTHSQHHKSTGNIDKDTAFVPHDRDSWLQRNFGEQARKEDVSLAHLSEDAPIVTLWNCVIHQIFGWPGYLLFNLTGQSYDGESFPQISHFYFGEDSVFWKKEQLGFIVLSDVVVAAMIALLGVAVNLVGWWNVAVLWGIPYLWVNHWIVAITFLQHTDASLPHYKNSTWSFARGATATIDRDFGLIDTHLFHDIIGTHVCHHLVSTIPFYHAGEASDAIRRVMGVHYKSDTKTSFMTAFWRNQRDCKFVEESVEGSGIYFFRNLYGKKGQATAKVLCASEELAEAEGDKVEELGAASKAIGTAMSSSRNMEAKRRLSQSVSKATLPLLAE